MIFYLGTHQPAWLAVAGVPLFVSRRRLAGRVTLPRAIETWALDSGGFSELSMFGHWVTDAATYVAEVRRFGREIGLMAWAAAQDWMCEPFITTKTGLSVAEHQQRTIANYLDLRDRAPELPWVPVLQGWRMDDYRRHTDDYDRAGVDLATVPVVGIGSVCRRQHTKQVEGVIRDLADRGLRLHGFGFKTLGLARLGSVLASADSMAWSFEARRERHPACGSTTHKNCANCLTFALSWRERVLAAVVRGNDRGWQMPLWPAAS